MKVAVVGGGIAGLLTSLELLELGAEVTLFESLRGLGSRAHCAGIVSTGTVERIPLAREFVDSSYSAARLLASPRGPELRIACSKPFAVRIDRALHERALAERVRERGAVVRLGTLVTEARVVPRGVELSFVDRVRGSTGSEIFDAVIVAEGFSRRLTRSLGLDAVRETFVGIQRVYAVRGGRVEGITTVFDSSLGRGGFAWLAALGDGSRALVGIVGERAGVSDLDRYAKLLAELNRVELTPSGRVFGGHVFRGYPRRVVRGVVAGVGDCVSMVKSLSGGGLYAISETFRAVARYVVEHAQEALSEIERVARVLRRQYRAYRALTRLMGVASIALRGRVVELELQSLDYDRHDEVLGRMMRSLWVGAVKRWRRADSGP